MDSVILRKCGSLFVKVAKAMLIEMILIQYLKFSSASLFDLLNTGGEIESPCNIDDSPFTDCISLNPKMTSGKIPKDIRIHSSLLYLANYHVEINGNQVVEKVVLKKSMKFHSIKFKQLFGSDGLTYEFEQDEGQDEGEDENKNEQENEKIQEGEIMRYLYNEAKFTGMPKLIEYNWKNTGWIVMSYFEGISLQEFYQAVFKDIGDIKVQNDHKFQDRMLIKKGIIYKELHDYMRYKLGLGSIEDEEKPIDNRDNKVDTDRNQLLDYIEMNGDEKKNGWFFNLVISQYIAISTVYVELLKKGVIHCNPSPSSIMIKKGTLGIYPTDIIIVDYSQSIKWNVETSQIFYSDIKESCISDLRPILAFLLADFGVYIPLSSIDVTFFGRVSLAPINVISIFEDSITSGQCIDYNNLLREYFHTNFNCRDLLVDYSSNQYNPIDCNTPLPYNAALPYNFKVFHFCQKTCGICNQECESLVSIMNIEMHKDYPNESDPLFLRESLIERLFKACRPNKELLSYDNLSINSLNEIWGEGALETKYGSKGNSSIEQMDASLLGCTWCITHQNILKTVLLHYELPQIILYPNIDLFIGNINILIHSHKTIHDSFKNYLINLNSASFKNILTGNIAEMNFGLKKVFINKFKDNYYIRRYINSYLLIGDEFYQIIKKIEKYNDFKLDSFMNSGSNQSPNSIIHFNFRQELLSDGKILPSGLLYFKILENDYLLINIKTIKHAFVRYMFRGFSSKYRERMIEMLRIYSLRMLPNSLKNFPLFESNLQKKMD
ncbi:Protein kinase-like domain containing protein [Cryptosporidium felis]|nr:Protein kinase-like domain containing protein [Cryptosporidium felis]